MIQKTFIIAEAGVNHNGDFHRAKQLVEAAKQVGADAVKFQTFRAERTISRFAPKAAYQRQALQPNETQLEMAKNLELSFESFQKLYEHAKKCQIQFLSTPFDEESVDFLDNLGVLSFKISSGDLTHTSFLQYIARKRKKLILSTGMSDLTEVSEAVESITSTGNKDIILLHCLSNYPADPREVNLRAMQTLKETFQFPVGYSDHTPGREIALAAVALGACIIEKHFTLDKNLPGPDHKASLDLGEFKELVQGIRLVESCLGDGRKIPSPSEEDVRKVARRSLVAAHDIPVGTILKKEMIAIKRPGNGLRPSLLPSLVGRRAKKDIAEGTLLTFEVLS